MLRNAVSGILAVLAVAASSPAAVLISASGVPTTGLAGYATFTVTASTNDGKQIQGFDFASFPAYGFFGPMNQVNPAGISTVFQDNNAFFPFVGADVSQDSQFKFFSSNVTVPGGFSSESATQLRSVFAAGVPLGTSVPFVQLAIPPLGTVQGVGQIQTVSGGGVFDNNVAFSITNPVPEPPTAILLGLALIGGCGFVRRRRGLARQAVALSGVLAVLALAASSQAGVIITSSGVATVGLPGYTTFTLTAFTTDGSQIQGFDFASQPSFGFFGSMNQVNPFGLPTIFADNNAIFVAVPADVSADSQFKFNSTTVTVPAGFASESSTKLRAVFAASFPLGTSVPFVQIASTGAVNFVGQMQTVPAGGGPPSDNNVAGATCLDCDPPQITDEIIDNVNANDPGFVNHKILVSGFAAGLSNFNFDSYLPAPGVSGTGPAIPATLNTSTRIFNWNTIGSPLGTYKWTLTATNFYGFDNGSLTVRITAVPEPATLGLFVLAVLGTLAVRRR